jgi:hypothetical protein
LQGNVLLVVTIFATFESSKRPTIACWAFTQAIDLEITGDLCYNKNE